MACTRCRLPYPSELVTAMYANGRYNGEQAELLRQDALDWRRRHPNAQAVPVR